MGGFQAAVSKFGKIVRRVFAVDAHLHMKIRRPRTFGLGGVDAINLAIDCSTTVLILTRIEIEHQHEATTTTSFAVAGPDSSCSMCLYACLCL
jgi:hypothetical protein